MSNIRKNENQINMFSVKIDRPEKKQKVKTPSKEDGAL